MEKTKEVLILEETIRVLRVENKHLRMVSENAIANAKEVESLSNQLKQTRKAYDLLEQRYKFARNAAKSLYKDVFFKY